MRVGPTDAIDDAYVIYQDEPGDVTVQETTEESRYFCSEFDGPDEILMQLHRADYRRRRHARLMYALMSRFAWSKVIQFRAHPPTTPVISLLDLHPDIRATAGMFRRRSDEPKSLDDLLAEAREERAERLLREGE